MHTLLRFLPRMFARTSIHAALPILIAVSSTALAPAAWPQESSNPAVTQEQINQQLMRRIEELEKEVQQLKAQSAGTVSMPSSSETTTAIAAAPAPVPLQAPLAASSDVNEVAPRLHLDVFGDIGVQGYNHVPSTFEFGSLDLFMNARLSERFSTLGEVLFIAQSDNSVGLDVERLWLQYRPNDYFRASIGRFHTWVGYYNSHYNKAEYLETTTDRPFVYAFDDQGGVLPMQEIGVNFTGQIPSGKLGLNYVLELGNGRAWGVNLEPVQNYQDANNSKSINGGLFIRPDQIRGLQLGFSLLYDNLTVPGPPVAETIATSHIVFDNGKYEILNEGVLLRHVEPTGPVFTTGAFYSQWSRAFGKYRPYFRYQYFNAPSDDPIYKYATPNEYAPLPVTGFVGRINGASLGVRYDVLQNVAVKFQFDRFAMRDLATENGLTLQFAFTF